jgi:hypothetical protein
MRMVLGKPHQCSFFEIYQKLLKKHIDKTIEFANIEGNKLFKFLEIVYD